MPRGTSPAGRGKVSLWEPALSRSALLAELTAAHPGFAAFVEHDRIAPITYPCEWSVSMLADAGRLTKLQRELLDLGLSLKDATAYNIQFVRGKPIFIDLTSIERPARLDCGLLWASSTGCFSILCCS